jgi:hypothetical protein
MSTQTKIITADNEQQPVEPAGIGHNRPPESIEPIAVSVNECARSSQ